MNDDKDDTDDKNETENPEFEVGEKCTRVVKQRTSFEAWRLTPHIKHGATECLVTECQCD